jgi:GIY-YIG catalytic domain
VGPLKRIPVRDVLFEVLYLAVCIATFSHTAYACSLLFQGPKPDTGDFNWYLEGALIAVAVDIGMLVTSRLLSGARTLAQGLSLMITFAITAALSFYAQIVYISLFTPTITISAGVSEDWRAFVEPILNARVLILPVALPALAIMFTIARWTHRPTVYYNPETGRTELSTNPIQVETPPTPQLPPVTSQDFYSRKKRGLVVGCIYCVTNTKNGKQYVGKTTRTAERRWSQHLQDARKGVDRPLYAAIREFGPGAFKLTMLEEVEPQEGNPKVLNTREAYWIEQLGTFGKGYNQTPGGPYPELPAM